MNRFYPCDYEVYKILKQLSFWYLDALRREAAWWRWKNKEPQNRVYVTRSGGARITGGPRPEPPWTNRDARLKKELEKADVVNVYRYARMPSQKEVEPLGFGFVSSLYKLAEEANKVD